MADLFTTGVASGIGVILGAIGSFFGLKAKTNSIEKRLDRFGEVVMYESTCDRTHEGLNKRLDDQNVMLKEIRDYMMKDK